MFFGLNRLFVRPLALGYYGWLLERQTHAKSRVAGLRLQVDRSVVLSHDAHDGIKAKARAFSHLLGSEEGIEDAPLPFMASMALSIILVHT